MVGNHGHTTRCSTEDHNMILHPTETLTQTTAKIAVRNNPPPPNRLVHLKYKASSTSSQVDFSYVKRIFGRIPKTGVLDKRANNCL